MNEAQKQSGALIYQVVISVVLLMACGLTCWTAQAVISQGKDIAALSTRGSYNSDRLTKIETLGSPVIQRIDAKLEALEAGQNRLETMQKEIRESLERHVINSAKP